MRAPANTRMLLGAGRGGGSAGRRPDGEADSHAGRPSPLSPLLGAVPGAVVASHPSLRAASQDIPLWGSPQVEIARYAGWLKKQPSKPGFTLRKRKWFELRSSSLVYRASPEAGQIWLGDESEHSGALSATTQKTSGCWNERPPLRVLPLRDNFGGAATVEAEEGSATFTVTFPFPSAPRSSITLTADTPVQAGEWVKEIFNSIAVLPLQHLAHPYVSPNQSQTSADSAKRVPSPQRGDPPDERSLAAKHLPSPLREHQPRGDGRSEAPRLTESNLAGSLPQEPDASFLSEWLRAVGSAGPPQDVAHPQCP
ncbi:hypothetical protein T484DRAFT_1907038 [Baffinella frigidus]|nr:hypothetical protein T484DRAFT_1907038 [Cryptophyta sp. CCMP2293]